MRDKVVTELPTCRILQSIDDVASSSYTYNYDNGGNYHFSSQSSATEVLLVRSKGL